MTTTELAADPRYQYESPLIARDEILDRVALGRLILVVGADAADGLNDRVIAVPVTDLPATSVVLGWLPETSRSDVPGFVGTMHQIATARDSIGTAPFGQAE